MATRGRARLLFIDGFVNLLLGVALLCFDPVASWLGVSASDTAFYPMILGAVLFGIGIALILEGVPGAGQLVGLGLGGAIAICVARPFRVWFLAC
jgi:hypothetical protein